MNKISPSFDIMSAQSSDSSWIHSSVAATHCEAEAEMAMTDLADSSDSHPRSTNKCTALLAPTSESRMRSRRATSDEPAESPTTTVEIEPEPEDEYDTVYATVTSPIAKSIVEHSAPESMLVDRIESREVTSNGPPADDQIDVCTSDTILERTGDAGMHSMCDESDELCTKQQKTNGRKATSKKRNGSTSGKTGSVAELSSAPSESVDGCDVIVDVTCGPNAGRLLLGQLRNGSRGRCVEFDGELMTPNQFQRVSGRWMAKDWKRSIKHRGRSLKQLIKDGIMSWSPPECRCTGCAAVSSQNIAEIVKPKAMDCTTNSDVITSSPSQSRAPTASSCAAMTSPTSSGGRPDVESYRAKTSINFDKKRHLESRDDSDDDNDRRQVSPESKDPIRPKTSGSRPATDEERESQLRDVDCTSSSESSSTERGDVTAATGSTNKDIAIKINSMTMIVEDVAPADGWSGVGELRMTSPTIGSTMHDYETTADLRNCCDVTDGATDAVVREAVRPLANETDLMTSSTTLDRIASHLDSERFDGITHSGPRRNDEDRSIPATSFSGKPINNGHKNTLQKLSNRRSSTDNEPASSVSDKPARNASKHRPSGQGYDIEGSNGNCLPPKLRCVDNISSSARIDSFKNTKPAGPLSSSDKKKSNCDGDETLPTGNSPTFPATPSDSYSWFAASDYKSLAELVTGGRSLSENETVAITNRLREVSDWAVAAYRSFLLQSAAAAAAVTSGGSTPAGFLHDTNYSTSVARLLALNQAAFYGLGSGIPQQQQQPSGYTTSPYCLPSTTSSSFYSGIDKWMQTAPTTEDRRVTSSHVAVAPHGGHRRKRRSDRRRNIGQLQQQRPQTMVDESTLHEIVAPLGAQQRRQPTDKNTTNAGQNSPRGAIDSSAPPSDRHKSNTSASSSTPTSRCRYDADLGRRLDRLLSSGGGVQWNVGGSSPVGEPSAGGGGGGGCRWPQRRHRAATGTVGGDDDERPTATTVDTVSGYRRKTNDASRRVGAAGALGRDVDDRIGSARASSRLGEADSASRRALGNYQISLGDVALLDNCGSGGVDEGMPLPGIAVSAAVARYLGNRIAVGGVTGAMPAFYDQSGAIDLSCRSKTTTVAAAGVALSGRGDTGH